MAQQPRRGGWTTAAVLGLLVLLMGRALYVQNETAQRRDGFMNGVVPRAHAHKRHDASEHVNFFDQFMRSEAEARSLREREADQQRWNTPEAPPPIQQKPLQRPGRGSTPRDECAFMMQKHSVIPGANWGRARTASGAGRSCAATASSEVQGCARRRRDT